MAETTELKKSDFYFDLPQELIAQDPLEDRSSSRLLVLDKNTGEISHHIFRDIIDYLHPGDCLVLNNTKVIPARLLGEREGTGGHVEVLLLHWSTSPRAMTGGRSSVIFPTAFCAATASASWAETARANRRSCACSRASFRRTAARSSWARRSRSVIFRRRAGSWI